MRLKAASSEILARRGQPGRTRRLTLEALKEGKIRNNLSHARDGVEAMAFLRHEGEFQDAPTPRHHPARPQTCRGRTGGRSSPS